MRTISPSEMEGYRKTAQQRRVAAERQRAQRLDHAWAVARKAAELLRERFQAQQVMAFGSLVHPDRFHLRSDVDIAVRGVDERQFLRAVAAITSLDSDIEVDLIAIEQAPESLLRTIEAEGRPL